MMYQKPMIAPYQGRNNCNTFFGVVVALGSLGVSIYIAHINRINLHYNMRNAHASEEISKQLETLNKSEFMHRLNGELEKENNYEQLSQKHN